VKSKVEIYAGAWSPELNYTCDFIFGEFLGLSYEMLECGANFSAHALKISYAPDSRNADLHIVPFAPIESLIKLPADRFSCSMWLGTPVFFKTAGSIPFDLFGAVFFLLARLDEHRQSPLDKHGRFPARSSVFAGTDILYRPVVDEWLIKIGELLRLARPELEIKKRTFQWINTFDIDVAYAYRGRSIGRNFLATMKNLAQLDLDRIAERFKVLINDGKDPFDTYETQRRLHVQADRTIYFFLNSSASKFDRALPINRTLKKLIAYVSQYAEVGIHPSYYSKNQPDLILKEKRSLETALNSTVIVSRQHYLRLELPQTMHHLEQAGIEEDFTLGFAEFLAFRCGTATPYQFFDPLARRALPVQIFPLHIMDATLRDYLCLIGSDALVAAKKIVDLVSNVGGSLCTLWHNDTLSQSEFPDWYFVYEDLAAYIDQKRSSLSEMLRSSQ